MHVLEEAFTFRKNVSLQYNPAGNLITSKYHVSTVLQKINQKLEMMMHLLRSLIAYETSQATGLSIRTHG
jgi:hypothetical protein